MPSYSPKCRPTNQCTRIAKRRLIESGWALRRGVSIASGIAGPQSRDFKRWAGSSEKSEIITGARGAG